MTIPDSEIVRPVVNSSAMRDHTASETCHSAGCRRPECRTAHAEGARRRRRLVAYGQWTPQSVPNIGARRRIEALQRLGWSMRELSRMLDCHPDRLSVLFLTQTGISPRNHQRVAALYDELWDRPAPQRTKGERISARRAMNRAADLDYAPPLAWNDDEIDDPAARPQRCDPRTNPERKVCGTLAAYRRHLRKNQPVDEACRKACDRREDAA